MAKVTMMKRVREAVSADGISKNKAGNFMFRKGYFYRHGDDCGKFANRVFAALTAAGITHTEIARGDHFAAFRGGASLANSSHFYVEVKIDEAQNA
jgi:hypothetical protein